MRWTELPIHFIDFEGSVGSGVLEYGVVTIQDGKIASTRSRLCGAVGVIKGEDVAIHGLSPAVLGGMSPFADDWEYFAQLRESGPLAAHFASVENSLLKAVWPYPRNSPNFARPGENLIDWGPWIDSARIFGRLFPSFKSGRLEVLVRACGLQEDLDHSAAQFCPVERRRYHAALYDSLAGAHLLLFLAGDERLAALSVMQLMALSVLSSDKRDSLLQDELF